MNFDKLKEIHPDIVLVGEVSRKPKVAVSLNENFFNDSTITWISSKNAELVNDVDAGTVICEKIPAILKQGVLYIQTKAPRAVFASSLEILYPRDDVYSISPQSIISKNVKMGTSLSVGHFTVIEDNVQIGNRVRIGHNTVIHKGTIIGDDVIIGSNCVVGGVGFGYEKTAQGEYQFIYHVGIVRICNKAEVGNNTCIDRAVLGETIIGENAKIDNLVHIAHGVKIGRNSLIIANAMVAGSVEIGENCWVAPSASVLNGIKVKSGSIIGMGAVVLREVEQNAVIVGNPGKDISKK